MNRRLPYRRPSDVPRVSERRTLTPAEVDIELAGIRAALQMGGSEFTPEAEEAARAVLNGEMTSDEAIARGLRKIEEQEAAEKRAGDHRE